MCRDSLHRTRKDSKSRHSVGRLTMRRKVTRGSTLQLYPAELPTGRQEVQLQRQQLLQHQSSTVPSLTTSPSVKRRLPRLGNVSGSLSMVRPSSPLATKMPMPSDGLTPAISHLLLPGILANGNVSRIRTSDLPRRLFFFQFFSFSSIKFFFSLFF